MVLCSEYIIEVNCLSHPLKSRVYTINVTVSCSCWPIPGRGIRFIGFSTINLLLCLLPFQTALLDHIMRYGPYLESEELASILMKVKYVIILNST